MKITIDVSEFYLGEDTDLEQGLKDYVSGQVIKHIFKSIEKRVEEHIERRVKDEIEQKLSRFINKTIEDLIATESIIRDGKTTTIADHIKNQFQNGYGWNNPQEAIKKLADQFGKELKARYDLQFASHVVAKLNEQGMLKDDIAKLILESNSQSK